MLRKIQIGEKKIKCLFRKSRRAKKVRLTIYCDGNLVLTVPYFVGFEKGEDFLKSKIGWIVKKLKKTGRNKTNSLLVRRNRKEYLNLKKQAFFLVKQKIEWYNKLYQFKYKRISIRNQKTRWGSCSRDGNLSFNYKILFLSEEMQNYLIVHELCHLGEFNHSKKFWKLVEKAAPDFRKTRREMRKI